MKENNYYNKKVEELYKELNTNISGLTEEEAKKLITLGYLNPIVKYFNDEKIKKQIVNSITKEI